MITGLQEKRKELLERWSFSGHPEPAEPQTRTLRSILFAYWMKFARILGIVNANILLTLFYLFIIGPAALVIKLFGKDLLDRRAEERTSYWYEKEYEKPDPERSKHQF